MAELRKLAWNTKEEVLQADKDGQLHFSLSLPTASVKLEQM
jgi:hypothetical protein